MDQNPTPNTPIVPGPQVSPHQPEAAPQVTPKQKKSFLKNPFFYIVVFLLLLFCIGYYYVYSTLESEVSKITHQQEK